MYELDMTRLRLCPITGALIRIAGGRVSGGARIDAPRLAGRLGRTPVTVAASGAELTLGARGFSLRDVAAEHERLRAAGAQVLQAPRVEPWGLVEMWLADPDGLRIVLVQVPEDHPLRRDQR